MNYATQIMMWVIIGGEKSFIGALIGLITMTYIGEILGQQMQQYFPLVLGGLFIVVLLTLKGGLITLFEIILSKIGALITRHPKSNNSASVNNS